MNSSKREKEIIKKLQTFSKLFGVRIANFKYYYKVFGNFLFEMICENETFVFMSDRGEIAVNNVYVLDDSYHIVGKPDIVFKKKKIAVFCDSEFWHGYDWENSKNDIKSRKNTFRTKQTLPNIIDTCGKRYGKRT